MLPCGATPRRHQRSTAIEGPTWLDTARRSNNSATHRPSMAQDIAKGRRTEIEFLNGFVQAKGAELGMETPANAAMVGLVRRVERGELAPSMSAIEGV